MTDLERFELVLRRVHSELKKHGFQNTDILYAIMRMVEELAKENILLAEIEKGNAD